MINSLKEKENKSNIKEFKVKISNKIKKKENQNDILKNFENDINKIVEK